MRRRRSRGGLAARAWPAFCSLLIAAVAVALHILAALRPGSAVTTLGEARMAVAAVVVRGAELAVDPLPLGDRFAALQLAVVQMLMPIGHVSVVEAARWACLAVGLVAALVIWPVLRGLGVSVPAAAAGVALLGASVPALSLHGGISAAAPAAMWLVIAALLAVRQWGRAAILAALVAVVTSPLAAAALLALAAHLVVDRTIPVRGRLRLPVGGILGLAALAVAAVAVRLPTLAGVAGPAYPTPTVVAAVAGGLLVIALAWRSADWLRPVLTAAALLLVAGLAPGPSRTAAALLVAPALAVAVGLLVDQLRDRIRGRATSAAAMIVLLAVIVASAAPVLLARPPAPTDEGALIAWLITEPAPGTAVRADDLDRAELLAAGFPAARLRGADDPVVPGELRLVTARPDVASPRAEPAGCLNTTAVAAAPRGTGGGPAAICRTDGGSAAVAAEASNRIRLGSALAENPSLRLTPVAAASLRAGEVDPRLMLVLGAMTTAHQVAVDAFPAVELDTADVPRRQALLSSIDGGSPATSGLLRTWLGAQQPPFTPTLVRPEGAALLVGYPAPPLGGLLPE